MRRLLVGIFCVAGLYPSVSAAEPIKLSRGQINQVMVLGTPHLSQLPKSFDPANLNLLHERLLSWKPQEIAIEEVSGLQCAYMRAYSQRYADSVKMYCPDTSAAQAATGLNVIDAMAQANQLLNAWPPSPSAAQRRKLAALFLAGGEKASAAVQWLRLPTEERHAGDGLTEELAAQLNALSKRRDETYLIAVPLAVKSGLERVVTMDDHTADDTIADEKGYGTAIMKAWDNPASVEIKQRNAALVRRLDTPAQVIDMYRAHNQPDNAELIFKSDFGAALEEPSPQHFGRSYVAYWETRNLRMASNIRSAMSPSGIRTLVIVGASHKAYLENYLNQMHDVRIISTDTVF